MSAGHLDTTKYTNMVNNAASQVKISSTVFKAFIADVKEKVDANYDQIALTSRSAFCAYQSTLQAVVGNTDTKINYQTEVYDHLAEYNTSTSRFTAQKAGIYLVSAAVSWAIMSSSNVITMSIYVNGARSTYIYFGDGSANVISCGNAHIKLNVNDYVEIYVTSESTVNTDIGATSCYFEMVQLA